MCDGDNWVSSRWVFWNDIVVQSRGFRHGEWGSRDYEWYFCRC